MSRPQLALVQSLEVDSTPVPFSQMLLWEAMEPVLGRQRIVAFSKGLVDAGLRPRTVHGYLGSLRRLFQYILEYPYIPGLEVQPIVSRYGRIEQPVLEYDYPVHTLDQEEEGFVLTGDQLLQFYDFVRLEHIGHNQKKLPASRDYSMIVIAGESGLRADEIRHLEALGPHRDLFYEHNCIQTRHGKGTKGSGKRSSPRLRRIPCVSMKTTSARTSPMSGPIQRSSSRKAERASETSAMWHNLHVITEEARKAGLAMPPKLSWHSLRKSFATNCMEQHPDRPWVLMDLMGHLNPNTLHRYVKHSRAYYDQATRDIVGALVAEATEMPGAG
jgi:integrase